MRSYKYLLCACLEVFGDSDFSLLYFAQSCSELDLRALLYAFFLRLDSFLIVVFAQGFVKVALDCLDGKILLMILSIRVITKLPNSEQSYKGKVKTHMYINRQNQSTTGKL
jgi:hypothetical protein